MADPAVSVDVEVSLDDLLSLSALPTKHSHERTSPMKPFVRALALLLFLPLLILPMAPAATATTAPSYVTVMFGRSGWQPAYRCTPLTGSKSLWDAVSYLSSLGIPASGGVVPGFTQQSTTCDKGYIIYPGWTQLQAMHEQFGFEAQSQSEYYDNWSSLSTVQQFSDNSCGSLPDFTAHGFTRANGMFAYPNNYEPINAQAAVTSCFAFSRKYGSLPTTPKFASTYPRFVRTQSVHGGSCNNQALACYGMKVLNSQVYMTPDQVVPMLNPPAGDYSAVQFYRFVAGTSAPGSPVSWDCSSPSTADHWTSQPELYCFEDFQAALALRSRTAVYTDPKTVAQAWGVPNG